MLTKIGREIWLANAGSGVIPAMNYSSKGYIPWRTIDSSTIKYFGCISRDHSFSRRVDAINNRYGYGIALGNGTTPVTDDDYTMESLVTAGSIVFQSAATEYDAVTNRPYGYVNMTITNNTSDDLTINELGLFITSRASSELGGGIDAYNDYTVMVDHTILDAPVVIAPNEVGIVQYRFEVDESQELTASAKKA